MYQCSTEVSPPYTVDSELLTHPRKVHPYTLSIGHVSPGLYPFIVSTYSLEPLTFRGTDKGVPVSYFTFSVTTTLNQVHHSPLKSTTLYSDPLPSTQIHHSLLRSTTLH